MSTKELRELDAWIAEHAMGYRWWLYDPKSDHEFAGAITLHHEKMNGWIRPKGGEKISRDAFTGIPNYTTDPAAAMAVLEKCLSSDRLTMPIELDRKRHKAGRFRLESGLMKNSTLSIEDTLPLAICLFAKQLFSKETK